MTNSDDSKDNSAPQIPINFDGSSEPLTIEDSAAPSTTVPVQSPTGLSSSSEHEVNPSGGGAHKDRAESIAEVPIVEKVNPGAEELSVSSGTEKTIGKTATPAPAPEAAGKAKNVDIVEHNMDISSVAKKFSSIIDFDNIPGSHGLDLSFVEQRLATDGPNILTPPKSKSAFELYFECLNNLFNLLLILAGILQFVLLAINYHENQSSIYIGIILIVVAFLNATIEFVQLQKSSSLLKSFMNMIPATCVAVRDGVQKEINAAGLVCGDLVFVRMGDKVPADMLVIKSEDLKVDNSSLTGESEPQERNIKNTFTNPLEATNLIFNGTHCVSGQCYGIVIRIGDSTVLGQIANLTNTAGDRRSPLAIEIDKFVRLIAFLAIFTAILFFIIGQCINNNISFSINFAIGMFCAWIPEGLPATVTMLLTFAAKRLSKREVLVKNLKGVDTLGAITLLATDKTGTLTRNQMTVAYIWTNGRVLSSTHSTDEGVDVMTNPEDFGVRNILHIATLCSGAKFDRTDVPVDQRTILADATEAGLVRFAGMKLPNFDDLPNELPKVFEIPFNSTNKWMMTVNKAPHHNGPYKLYIKGAPERVLALCSSIIYGGEVVPLTEEKRDEYNSKYEFMAGKGHRVLAFAELELIGKDYPEGFEFSKNPINYPVSNYTFVGLVSLEDPPKHGVREAVGRFRSAGVQVVMVTGDHPLTAEAIGRKINLVLGETKKEVAKRTGRPIEEIQEDEYDAVVIHGIAMNKSGSDVSKEAASMILLDDNFASTINGVEEGRLIFANIKKSIRYTVCHSIPEVIPQLLTILVPLPVILGPLEIIVIDLGFELFNSLSYAWEPVESKDGLMTEMPRSPVNSRSIKILRDRKARHINDYDPETDELIVKTGFDKYYSMAKAPFTKIFWDDIREKKVGESLIDADLLIYSYIEMGCIMFACCFLNWFFVINHHKFTVPELKNMANQTNVYFKKDSPDYLSVKGILFTGEMQERYTREASGAYYFCIFMMQVFNNYACKTRYKSPLGLHMFRNVFTLYGALGGFIISIIVIYVPPFNTIFNTNYHLSPIWWLPPIGFGFVVLFYNVIRVSVMKKFRPMKTNPEIAGLMMYPTKFSTRGSKA
ncbi:Sodium/potassium-transporting ATPase subunit alpha-1 [Smittium mucronatum]|uniref:Sodium/potassium-transporting ATPase subunit alpha-1 n=1 Tax=Smittium mucronatum TaxID=133383 RepID=A0A1R0H504_9FUNG|nr:Sodium/potassium-transporting ATPase subunit alpha-1 [Smittium mucronatum]